MEPWQACMHGHIDTPLSIWGRAGLATFTHAQPFPFFLCFYCLVVKTNNSPNVGGIHWGQAQWPCRMSIPASCLTGQLCQGLRDLVTSSDILPQMPGFLSQAISMIILDLGQPNRRPARLTGTHCQGKKVDYFNFCSCN